MLETTGDDTISPQSSSMSILVGFAMAEEFAASSEGVFFSSAGTGVGWGDSTGRIVFESGNGRTDDIDRRAESAAGKELATFGSVLFS